MTWAITWRNLITGERGKDKMSGVDAFTAMVEYEQSNPGRVVLNVYQIQV